MLLIRLQNRIPFFQNKINPLFSMDTMRKFPQAFATLIFVQIVSWRLSSGWTIAAGWAMIDHELSIAFNCRHVLHLIQQVIAIIYININQSYQRCADSLNLGNLTVPSSFYVFVGANNHLS